MMDPAVKTALALFVLLTGVCAAMIFRHDRPRQASPNPGGEEALSLRYRVESALPSLRPGKAGRSATAWRQSQEAPNVARPATVVTPSERRESPPPLAPEYPETDRPAISRWGASMEMMLPMAATTDETARTHRVVDGDTLPALAERYLGSAARAQEVYQANRGVLSNPDLLPIGVELKLPPRRPAAPAVGPSSGAVPHDLLVPVR
jgi:phage tail protein X